MCYHKNDLAKTALLVAAVCLFVGQAAAARELARLSPVSVAPAQKISASSLVDEKIVTDSTPGQTSPRVASTAQDADAAQALSKKKNTEKTVSYWFRQPDDSEDADHNFKRPILYWRHWAAKPPHAVPCFLFLLLVTVVFNELFPKRLVTARKSYAGWKSFLKNFGVGILSLLILVTLIKAAFWSELLVPLAWACFALMQFLCLAGFAVSASSVGKWFCSLPLSRKLNRGNELPSVMVPVLGTFFISLLLIPTAGILSGIGLRLIMQLCIIGLGACLRTRMGTIDLEENTAPGPPDELF